MFGRAVPASYVCQRSSNCFGQRLRIHIMTPHTDRQISNYISRNFYQSCDHDSTITTVALSLMLSTRFDISSLCESRCRTQSPATNIIIVLTRDFRTSHHILFTKTPETSSQVPIQTKQSSLFARPGTQSAGRGHEVTGSLAESERLSRLAKIRFAHTTHSQPSDRRSKIEQPKRAL